MSTLFLSIATSGLPGATKMVWACRMSAALCDDAGAITDSFSVNIRAESRHVESGAARIHGITTAQASRTGVDEAFALTSICGLRASGRRTSDRPGLISCARILVAWDAAFVCTVITGLFAKHGEPSNAWLRPGLQVVGLQEHARLFCKLPAENSEDGQYRKPTRDEAAFELCGLPARDLPHGTDSNLDLERRIYGELRARNAFEAVAA